MTTAPSVRRFGILIATASAILTACSPSSDGGGGPPVQQQPIETVSSDFNFTATGTFTVGDSPANATFTGGVATGGMWVIPDGQTGVISFTTPTRDLSFTVEGLDANSAAARFAKTALPGAFRKTTCGISDQGFDNTEPFGTEMFVRGGFNDWPALPAAPQNFVNFGDGTLQAEFELTAGEWEFKIASPGWDVQYAPDPATQGTLQAGGPALTMEDTAPVGPNGSMNIPAEGCYNFLLNVADPAAPTIALTEVEIGGGPPAAPGATEITSYDTTGAAVDEAAIEDTVKTTYSVTRSGPTTTPVKRVEIFADNGDVGIDMISWQVNPVDIPATADVTISYHSASGDYSNTTIEFEGQSYACMPDAGNAFGCSATVSAPIGGSIVFTVTNNGVTDPTGTFIGGPIPDGGGTTVTVFSGNPDAVTGATTTSKALLKAVESALKNSQTQRNRFHGND